MTQQVKDYASEQQKTNAFLKSIQKL